MESLEMRTFAGIKELITALADFFIRKVNEAVEEKGHCSVALSGGHSPQRLYELLASPAYCEKVDWEKVHFFLGDERYVPQDDSRSNAGMVKKTLMAAPPLARAHLSIVNTMLPPEQAAADYWKQVKAHFKEGPVRFDFILLGLGENAHTASLFPSTAVLQERSAGVKAVFVPELEAYRITFTVPLINQARQVAFLVFGAGKAEAVKNVFSVPVQAEKFPAQLIKPFPGTLTWFMDEAASSLLKGATGKGMP
jgi:6-phosphogluconolactonase